jgi:tRNA uridine 5-carboxymethylaminomethyl modification enzyme
MNKRYEVLVVGGGHAGIEAAAAASRVGARTAMVSLDAAAVGRMSCNPAIGGVGKGQLAREVDALGGVMGLATDRAGIQFRMLNTSKGKAVQSPRAQCDRDGYEVAAQAVLAETASVETIAGEAVGFLWREDSSQASGRQIDGLQLADGRELRCDAVILTTGTFLEGLLHTGMEKVAGGRFGEAGAAKLGDALRTLGLPTARLKTGTPPRLAADSVDYSIMKEQPGDDHPVPFSFLTERIEQAQVPCWITSTNARTHAIVRDNLHVAPMYAGRIDGVGPRYCPSLEDKVVRFADRDSHHVFLEPEGYDSPLLYANGISTSLPAEIQLEFVRTCAGMEAAEIVQPGYAVEYTHVAPRCLLRTLELRDFPGIYLAGQICGTSGYEEAAAQGLMAGLNAALKLAGREPFILGRHEAYIGVLIDDLVVSDPSEPYRMFTSRAEHRLLLRHDNADRRLTARAIELGVVSHERRIGFEAKHARIEAARAVLNTQLDPESRAAGGPRKTLADRMRRVQDENWRVVMDAVPELATLELSDQEWDSLQADVQYEGYARRQQNWVDRSSEREHHLVPGDFEFSAVRGLRSEAIETLTKTRPQTLGAAGRLAGVTPSDLALLEVALVRQARAAASSS